MIAITAKAVTLESSAVFPSRPSIIVEEADGAKIVILVNLRDLVALAISLAKSLETDIGVPVLDGSTESLLRVLTSDSALESTKAMKTMLEDRQAPRPYVDVETRLRLVEALAPTIAEGLSGRSPDSAFVDTYFSTFGSFVDRLQAIVERAPAKEAAP
jgi:hypothetical protein